MGYTQAALEDKILDMYPEIRKYSISPRLSFNGAENIWTVKLVKGKKEKVVKPFPACWHQGVGYWYSGYPPGGLLVKPLVLREGRGATAQVIWRNLGVRQPARNEARGVYMRFPFSFTGDRGFSVRRAIRRKEKAREGLGEASEGRRRSTAPDGSRACPVAPTVAHGLTFMPPTPSLPSSFEQ